MTLADRSPTPSCADCANLRSRVAELEWVLEAADRLADYMLNICRADTDQNHASAYRIARRRSLATLEKDSSHGQGQNTLQP